MVTRSDVKCIKMQALGQFIGRNFLVCLQGTWFITCILDCQQPLGVANGALTELQISASTEWDFDHSANIGRLFKTFRAGAWAAGINDGNQWIQLDLGGRRIKVTRVATQGRYNGQSVTTYKLQYSENTVNFYYYKEQGQTSDKVSDNSRPAKFLNSEGRRAFSIPSILMFRN